MLSASEYTCTNSSLRQDLQSWLTTHTKTKQNRKSTEWVNQVIQLCRITKIKNTARDWTNRTAFALQPLIVAKHYHRSSGHGWGLVCGIPWLPKWHSQLGLSLTQLQSHSSLAVFCRTAWWSSSALFYCLSAPGKGSNGQTPPGSSLTHQESMYLSTTQGNQHRVRAPPSRWGQNAMEQYKYMELLLD